ncbi:MAG: N-formylglutamate amidohydrolase [Deltaproteobacteria bacterium]|nr:N-formylglutamate amidohydrolase [Deltaproteobacteria bacterium]MCW5808934.1 N-formylglutamate amidohydrolase [Deltaproteobacteria bacterium]
MIGLVLSCEHASWRLPPGVDLGVPVEVLRSQAGWDHGALEIANHVSEHVGLPVHAGLFSRMYVDLNRGLEHADVIPLVSYGAPVPGNARLAAGDRAARLAGFHEPYWDAVRRDVAARLRDRGGVLHFSSHTFSPELDPPNRQFDVGVLYDPAHAFEAGLAERLLFALRAAGLAVRANQPYGGVGAAICTSLRQEHAGARYAGIQLETSHAVTHTPGGCARVAAAIAPFLDELP